MKRKIILYGHLHDKLPRDIEVEANTVAEALKYLQLQPELTPKKGEFYPVTVKDVNSDVALFGINNMEEIHVYPRISGGGGSRKGSWIQIAIGIVILAVAIYFTGGLAGFVLAVEAGGLAATAGLLGAGLIIGGLIQLLMPVPEIDAGESEEGSKHLATTQNTVKIGTRIPVLYGTRKWSGHFLSFDVDANNDSVVSSSSNFIEHDVVISMTKDDYPILPIFSDQTASLTNVPSDRYSE